MGKPKADFAVSWPEVRAVTGELWNGRAHSRGAELGAKDLAMLDAWGFWRFPRRLATCLSGRTLRLRRLGVRLRLHSVASDVHTLGPARTVMRVSLDLPQAGSNILEVRLERTGWSVDRKG